MVRHKLTMAALHRAAHQAEEEEGATTCASIARQLGVGPRLLNQRFRRYGWLRPTLQVANGRLLPDKVLKERYLRSGEALRDEGVRVTRRRLAERLGVPMSTVTCYLKRNPDVRAALDVRDDKKLCSWRMNLRVCRTARNMRLSGAVVTVRTLAGACGCSMKLLRTHLRRHRRVAALVQVAPDWFARYWEAARRLSARGEPVTVATLAAEAGVRADTLHKVRRKNRRLMAQLGCA